MEYLPILNNFAALAQDYKRFRKRNTVLFQFCIDNFKDENLHFELKIIQHYLVELTLKKQMQGTYSVICKGTDKPIVEFKEMLHDYEPHH
jgi:hypothetical protein